VRKITRRIKREKEREKRAQLNDANLPSGQFINRRRRRVLLLWQKSNHISQTSSSWGKNTLCFVFKRTERENKEEEKRDDKERGNICGDESKKELLVLVPFQERERERERVYLWSLTRFFALPNDEDFASHRERRFPTPRLCS